MRPLFPLLLCVMALGLLGAACGGGGNSAATGSSGNGGEAPSTCPLPTPLASPRFNTDILPALQSSCGSSTSSCHGSANPPAGHIRYDTSDGRTATEVYNALINVAPSSSPTGWFRVKPGDPSSSWLLEKVTSNSPGGGGYGTRMPQAAPNLCQVSVDNLRAWIQAGAPF